VNLSRCLRPSAKSEVSGAVLIVQQGTLWKHARMFDVEIWGNVAEMTGALSTGGAAFAAAIYYIRDSWASRASQARLVRANLHPEEDGIFEISVTNDSDRPISLELLFWWERSFDRALLAGRPMETRTGVQIGTDDAGNPVIQNGPIEDAYKSVSAKEDLLGYGVGGGTTNVRAVVGDDLSRVKPGTTERFLMPTVLYRISTEYRLYFFDANGLAWELELLKAPSSPGKLRRSRYRHSANRLSASSRRRMKPIGYARVFNRRIRTHFERRLWLYKHRSEKTTPYARLTAESWERLMEARSERLEAKDPPRVHP
jgi:hypothetical protein